MKVIWSAQAKITFLNVLDYLNKIWTIKEIIQFNRRTEITITAIQKNPGIFPASIKKKKSEKLLSIKTTHSITK